MVNDKTLEQFRRKPPDARKTMWFGAMKMVRTGKAGYAQEAAKMLDHYEAIELAGERPKASVSVGALRFEPHGHGFVSFGYARGEMVVSIRKTEQHRHAGNRVYQVNVLGQIIPETCGSIEETRELGAFEYAKKSGVPA